MDKLQRFNKVNIKEYLNNRYSKFKDHVDINDIILSLYIHKRSDSKNIMINPSVEDINDYYKDGARFCLYTDGTLILAPINVNHYYIVEVLRSLHFERSKFFYIFGDIVNDTVKFDGSDHCALYLPQYLYFLIKYIDKFFECGLLTKSGFNKSIIDLKNSCYYYGNIKEVGYSYVCAEYNPPYFPLPKDNLSSTNFIISDYSKLVEFFKLNSVCFESSRYVPNNICFSIATNLDDISYETFSLIFDYLDTGCSMFIQNNLCDSEYAFCNVKNYLNYIGKKYNKIIGFTKLEDITINYILINIVVSVVGESVFIRFPGHNSFMEYYKSFYESFTGINISIDKILGILDKFVGRAYYVDIDLLKYFNKDILVKGRLFINSEPPVYYTRRRIIKYILRDVG